MKFALVILMGLFCFQAFAGYQCQLNLSHAEESDIIIGEKDITVRQSETRFKNEGTLVEESLEDKISLKSFMTGRVGEEEAFVEIFRGDKLISERFEFRGDEARTVWFDSYKLDVSCSIKEKGPKALSSISLES